MIGPETRSKNLAREDVPIVTQLKRAAAIRDRWIAETERLAVEAMDAGVTNEVVANIFGRSKEHLRTVVRKRVEDRAAGAATKAARRAKRE